MRKHMAAYTFVPLTSLWHLAAGALVLLLPGLAWQAWFLASGQDFGQRLADAVGLSLALTALGGLVAFLAGWSLSNAAVIAVYALLAVVALVPWLLRARRQRVSLVEEGADVQGAGSASGRGIAALTLLGLALMLAWRLYQARDLILPAWVDSLHHVLIVQLILENGGLPDSFAPYMPVPFYYHFNFHLVTALFAFFSRLNPALATLLLGQALNAVVALTVYRLGMALWQDWRRAGVAALLVGFVTQMPAYYITWGRYTLLVGLTLLPLAMAAAVELSRMGGNPERVARLALLTAGLLLAHYFAALMFALFLAVQMVLLLIWRGREPGEPTLWRALPLLGAAGLGLALASPWLFRVWGFASAYTRLRTVSPGQSLDAIYFADYLPYLWYLMGPDRNLVLLGLAALSLVLLGWRARSQVLGLWTAGLLLLGFPWGLRLTPFRPDHAIILLFLPATLWLGEGFLRAWEIVSAGHLARIGRTAVIAGITGFLVWGLRETNQIINPVTVLVQPGDLQAIDWVAENTPQEARFYINSTLWQRDQYRGVDGGWWILPLTGRETLIPPSMYQLGEPDYVARVNALAERAASLQGCTSELRDLLQAGGFTYIYLGTTPGSLDRSEAADCPFLERVFDAEGVTIYRLIEALSSSPRDPILRTRVQKCCSVVWATSPPTRYNPQQLIRAPV